MKKRILSLLVIAAFCLSLLPQAVLAASAGSVSIGALTLSGSTDAPAYACTSADGTVTTTGADESNYNIKWDGATLTLRNATVNASDAAVNEGDAVRAANDITVNLIGDNRLTGIGKQSAGLAVYNQGALRIGGSGSLVVEGAHAGIYIHDNAFTITGGSITANGGVYCYGLTMSDGALNAVTTANHIGLISEQDARITGGSLSASGGLCGIALFYDHDLHISGDAAVTATGGVDGIRALVSDGQADNCDIHVSGGSLAVTGGEQAINLHGDLHIAPADGARAAVATGTHAEDAAELEGSPFSDEALLTDAVGDSSYLSVSMQGSSTALPFTDVRADDWFYDPVCYVYNNGLMTGTSATTFEPNTSLSRAMLVAVLHRLEGNPQASAGDFTDVADGDWYAQAVNWAASVGIVNGFDDGTFQPNAAITREQMAAILRNYAQYKGLDVTTSGDLTNYSDAASVSDWAKESVAWAVDQGLLSGMTVDTLQPQGLSTRAQVATVLQRYLKN